MPLRQRFTDTLRRLIPHGKSHPRVTVALSGGIDSTVLTHLMALTPGFDTDAVTIDHRYRPQSTTEAHSLTLPPATRHRVIAIDWQGIDPCQLPNFESVARAKRYDLLISHCHDTETPYLVLGHTKDDQIETFVQRLLSNSTIFGLRCMQPIVTTNSGITLIRPLLDTSKADLYQYAHEHGIPWIEDPTNANPHLTKRNTIRHYLSITPPRPQLTKLIHDINSYTTMIQNRIDQLYALLVSQGSLQFDPQLIRYTCNFASSWFQHPANAILIDRFLWSLNYSVSPMSQYHYSYSHNIDLFDRIAACTHTTKFNKFGSQWQITRTCNETTVQFMREPPRRMRDTVLKIDPGSTSLFDNRLIVTSRCDTPIYMKIFQQTDFKPLARSKIHVNVPQKHDLIGLPVLLDPEMQIILFPTLQETKDIQVKFRHNPYIHI